MTSPIKATRATITLGDIEVDGYQLPDGAYKVSTQTFKDTLDSLIGDSTGKKYLKPILEASCSIVKNVKIEGYNRSIVMYGLDTFSEVIAAYASLGNKKAIAILIACMSETLERRFDNAFGILRSEEERNARFIARKDSILQRHFWTDTIKWYIDTHPELSDNSKKFLYPNVSNTLNSELFGMTAKEIRLHLDMDASENVRDCICPTLLPDVTFVEKYAATRVKQGLEPMQAIKEAVVFCNYDVRDPKTGLAV
jgi:hypothetical protein